MKDKIEIKQWVIQEQTQQQKTLVYILPNLNITPYATQETYMN